MRCCRRLFVVDAEHGPDGDMVLTDSSGNQVSVPWDEFVRDYEAMAISVELRSVEDDAASA